MVSIEFHLRWSTRGREYPGSLLVRVISERKSASLTLPYRLYPTEWDECKKKVLPEEGTRERERYLQEIAYRLEKDRRLLLKIWKENEERGEMNAHAILSVFKMRRFQSGLRKMVTVLAEELLAKGQSRTARAYRSSLNALLLYKQSEDISADEITAELVEGFQYWLKERGRSLNTISFYMRNLRAVYNKSVSRGWIVDYKKELFKNVYTGVAVSVKRALSLSEMQKLENLIDNPDILAEQEKEALNLFLFAFHGRGISFVDMAYLKKEDIKEERVYYKRRKTGTALQVQLTSKMKKHLLFFKEKTKESPYLFPLLSASSLNVYRSYEDALKKQNHLLHRIARKIGIKSLTTHMARHSWATIAKKKDIPIWVISEALGHQSVKTTYIYLDSFGNSVIDKAALKVSKATQGSRC